MIDIEALKKALLEQAPKAFGDAWDQVKKFLPTELHKLALQIADIAENVAKFELDKTQGYPPELGRVLLRMQRNALESVLMAATAMTLIAAERAINALLAAVRSIAGHVLDLIV